MQLSIKVSPFYLLLFLFFFTLSADQLHMQITLFKLKLNHLFALTLLIFVLGARKGLMIYRPLLLPTAFLLGSIFLSALLGAHIFRSMGYFFAFIFEFICYFWVPFHLMVYRSGEKILRIYLLAYQCLGLYALLQLLFSLVGLHDPLITQWIREGIARPNAFAYEPSYYALCISSFVMYENVLFILKDQSPSWIRFTLVNLFLLLSMSTGGFFAYFFLFLICLSFQYLGIDRFPNLRKALFLFLALVGSIGLLSWDLLSRYHFKFFVYGLQHDSFLDRWKGIVNSWNTFLDHPIFGVGIGGVGPYVYRTTENIRFENLTLEQIEMADPTNVFTEILASLGIVGLIGFSFLSIAVFKLFKTTLQSPFATPEERQKVLALLISLLVVLLELQFNQGLFRNYLWVHMGLACGYCASLRRFYTETILEF